MDRLITSAPCSATRWSSHATAYSGPTCVSVSVGSLFVMAAPPVSPGVLPLPQQSGQCMCGSVLFCSPYLATLKPHRCCRSLGLQPMVGTVMSGVAPAASVDATNWSEVEPDGSLDSSAAFGMPSKYQSRAWFCTSMSQAYRVTALPPHRLAAYAVPSFAKLAPKSSGETVAFVGVESGTAVAVAVERTMPLTCMSVM